VLVWISSAGRGGVEDSHLAPVRTGRSLFPLPVRSAGRHHAVTHPDRICCCYYYLYVQICDMACGGVGGVGELSLIVVVLFSAMVLFEQWVAA